MEKSEKNIIIKVSEKTENGVLRPITGLTNKDFNFYGKICASCTEHDAGEYEVFMQDYDDKINKPFGVVKKADIDNPCRLCYYFTLSHSEEPCNNCVNTLLPNEYYFKQ